MALRAALEEIAESDLTPDQDTHPDTIIVCLDSRAALQTVDAGPAAQTSQLGDAIWRLLMQLANRGRRLHLQWVPAHCGLPGNERADMLAMEAAELEQTNAPPPWMSRASPAPPPGLRADHGRRACPAAGTALSSRIGPCLHRCDSTAERQRWIFTSYGPATGAYQHSTSTASAAGRPPTAPAAWTPPALPPGV